MTSEALLRAHCAAFGAGDAGAIAAAFAPNGLYELPLLGQRLVGGAEIRAGLAAAFALVETAAIDILGLKSSAAVAIAEGRLRAKLRRDSGPVEMPLAMVLGGSGDGMIRRLSVHLDARPYRLWCDGPIFALPH